MLRTRYWKALSVRERELDDLSQLWTSSAYGRRNLRLRQQYGLWLLAGE